MALKGLKIKYTVDIFFPVKYKKKKLSRFYVAKHDSSLRQCNNFNCIQRFWTIIFSVVCPATFFLFLIKNIFIHNFYSHFDTEKYRTVEKNVFFFQREKGLALEGLKIEYTVDIFFPVKLKKKIIPILRRQT